MSWPTATTWPKRELHAYLAAEEAHTRRPAASGAACARAWRSEMVPASVSISAYNSLVACPYQFYARHILRLNELDEVQEGIEKRDYGERVHDILHRFHERYPQVSGHAVAEMEAALRQISEEVFADLLQQDFAARAWLARWFAVAACLSRMAAGERSARLALCRGGERVRLAAGRRAPARTHRPAGCQGRRETGAGLQDAERAGAAQQIARAGRGCAAGVLCLRA